MTRPTLCYTAPPSEAGLVVIYLTLILTWCNVVVVNLAAVDMVSAPPDPYCAARNRSFRIPPIDGGKIAWSGLEQSLVLSACHFGVAIAIFPAVWMYWMWSSKTVLMVGTVALGAVTCATPELAKLHWSLAVALRFLSGCGYGLLDQSAKALLRSCTRSIRKLQTASFFGAYLGLICGYSMTGAALFWFRNWTLPYYIWGVFHCVWCLVVYFYLELNSLRELVVSLSFVALREVQPVYRSIVSSRAVWAIVVARVGNNVVLYTLITYMPKYFANILSFNITENTLALSAAFTVPLCLTFYTVRISNWLVEDHNWNKTLVRKAHVLISSLLTAVTVVGAVMQGCNKVLAVLLLSLAAYCTAVFDVTINANVLDLTSDYSMFVMALADSFGALAAFASNVSVGFITTRNSRRQWRTVYWAYLCFHVVCALVYCFTASGKRASWDYYVGDEETKPTEKVKWYLEVHPDEFKERKRLKSESA